MSTNQVKKLEVMQEKIKKDPKLQSRNPDAEIAMRGTVGIVGGSDFGQ